MKNSLLKILYKILVALGIIVVIAGVYLILRNLGVV